MSNHDDILTKEERPTDRAILPPPSLDLAKYHDLLDSDVSLTEEQRDAILAVVSSICAEFVRWGWDVKNIPAFLPEIFSNPSDVATGAISSSDEEGDNDTA